MTKFEDIRPYNNSEIALIIKELVSDPMFIAVVNKLYPQEKASKQILQKMAQIKTIEELQETVIINILHSIEKASTKGISYSAMDQFEPDECYLFISNHRDIILDSAFLNYIIHKQGFRKTEIAIGDNLLAFNWIEKLVRINRSFIVKRNLGLRDQLNASKVLSEYIRFAITEKRESVWIAQREGRTKDGDDQTQAALLKMLNMSNNNTLVDGFRQLNIVPMAISYEIEPCGISKVEELLNRKHKPDFVKSQQDDLKSMTDGVMLPKGRIHFGFGNPLNIKIENISANKSKNEAVQAIVDYIDQRIYANYKLWPNNYIAADLTTKNNKYSKEYTADQKSQFIEQMEKDASSITFDKEEIVEMYLKMYANPVFNFEKYSLNG